MYSFFENTVNNMGYNLWGSCGFIALEMILKYYDLYLNDNVVPEIYDQEYEIDYQINYNTSFSSNIDIVEGDFANGYLSENEISCNVNRYIPSGTSDFLTYIKNKIDSGVPVILKLVDTDSEGNYIAHGVVAYDYSGSTIYFNDGYGINCR